MKLLMLVIGLTMLSGCAKKEPPDVIDPIKFKVGDQVRVLHRIPFYYGCTGITSAYDMTWVTYYKKQPKYSLISVRCGKTKLADGELTVVQDNLELVK